MVSNHLNAEMAKHNQHPGMSIYEADFLPILS